MTKIAAKPENLAQIAFFIRGEKVMLDADLAMLYEVETGALNRAVKRNVGRFPDDFMFQFTSEDWENLMCQIGISKSPNAVPGAKNLNSSQTVMRSRVSAVADGRSDPGSK
jgi:hypothetical protein